MKSAKSNPFTAILNAIIKKALPKINAGISSTIKDKHLDPWGQVAHGDDRLGSIDLGICHASVDAKYAVQNMRGLSGFEIDSLVVTNSHTAPGDDKTLVGTIVMKAGMSGDLSTHVAGGIEAKCGFVHKSIGIGGSAGVSGLSATGSGNFEASLTNDGKICLTKIYISGVLLDFAHVNVSIDGLGIFNKFLDVLVNAIVHLFKGKIRDAISAAIRPILNMEVGKALPQCHSL